MSDMLKGLLGDDEEYYDEYDDDSEESYDDEQLEDEEEELDPVQQQEELRHQITLKTQSERKQETKKKHDSKFTVPNLESSKRSKQVVLTMTEEEMQHYHNLKLYGIQGPKKKEQTINEEVNFKLDVLQSSKMFFEFVDPTLVTILTGSKAYVKQYNQLTRTNYHPKYDSHEEMMKHELTQPRFTIEECSHTKSFNFVQQLLNRTDHISCVSTDQKYLFICGGRSGSVLYNDFISYEIASGKMNVYRDLMLVSMNFHANDPALNGYSMVENGGNVYILCRAKYGKTLNVIKISHISRPLDLHYSTVFTNYWNNTPFMPPDRNYFTQQSTHSTAFGTYGGGFDIYIFGGKTHSSANSVVDEMFVVNIPTIVTTPPTQARCTKIEKPKRGEGDWPSARYHHSSCMIANLIFVFGGMNAKNQLLNDLYMFDTTSQVWTEINVESMLPPPVFKHQVFSINNQSFYVYGGQHVDGISNSLFRFDIVDKKWSLIEIVSDENKLRLAGHHCLVAQTKLWIVGGFTTSETTTHEKNAKSFCRLLNSNDPGKRLPICNYLESKRREGYLCDVVFKVKDVKESAESQQEEDTYSYILAHKCIIKSRCSFLHEKIQSSHADTINSQQFEGTFLDENLTIVVITECHTHIFQKYLDYLYTSAINLCSALEVHQFLEFTKLASEFKHFPFIQKICSLDSRKDLSLTRNILDEMHSDFSSLIDDKTYSDLVIVLDQENQFNQQHQPEYSSIVDGVEEEELLSPLSSSNIPSSMGGISVHRLIVSRSPFFSRMFVTSGMLETTEKVVHLTDYSKEVMLDLLKYLYTDIIHLTPRNCLGILVYCLMLDLSDLASCCRRMVSSLLDNNNVWTIHEISVLYNEKTLESDCEHYIANNYVSLCTHSSFLDLPDMSRIKIKQIVERKNKKKI